MDPVTWLASAGSWGTHGCWFSGGVKYPILIKSISTKIFIYIYYEIHPWLPGPFPAGLSCKCDLWCICLCRAGLMWHLPCFQRFRAWRLCAQLHGTYMYIYNIFKFVYTSQDDAHMESEEQPDVRNQILLVLNLWHQQPAIPDLIPPWGPQCVWAHARRQPASWWLRWSPRLKFEHSCRLMGQRFVTFAVRRLEPHASTWTSMVRMWITCRTGNLFSFVMNSCRNFKPMWSNNIYNGSLDNFVACPLCAYMH